MTTTSSKTERTCTPAPTLRSEVRKLWKLLPHPPGSVVRTFARKGDIRTGDYATKWQEVARFADDSTDMSVYVAPNPTNHTGGVRHSAKHVTHWSYFLIDVDPVCTCKKARLNCAKCNKAAAPLSYLEECLTWIGEWMGVRLFGSRVPLVIDSGRGAQAWVRLEDVELDDSVAEGTTGWDGSREDGTETTSRKTARKTCSYWLKKLEEKMGTKYNCRLDTSTCDLPRVMRCPGTVNLKTGRMATIVFDSGTVFEGLATRLVVGVPKQVFEEPEVPSGMAGRPWQEVFPHLTLTAQEYLLRGKEEPGRHKVMWHTAKKLKELGVTRTEARRALKRANELKGKDEELERDQIEHALDTAYEGED